MVGLSFKYYSFVAINILLKAIEMNAMGKAYVVGAGRYETVVHPLVTEIAFPGDPVFIVKDNRAIGAFVNARLTPGTSIRVQHHNPVFPFEYDLFRACFRAGRIIAVSAKVYMIDKVKFAV